MSSLPTYLCTKSIGAFKIEAVVPTTNASSVLLSDASLQTYRVVDSTYVAAHNPQAGGYYIEFDGSPTYADQAEFESMYQLAPAAQ